MSHHNKLSDESAIFSKVFIIFIFLSSCILPVMLTNNPLALLCYQGAPAKQALETYMYSECSCCLCFVVCVLHNKREAAAHAIHLKFSRFGDFSWEVSCLFCSFLSSCVMFCFVLFSVCVCFLSLFDWSIVSLVPHLFSLPSVYKSVFLRSYLSVPLFLLVLCLCPSLVCAPHVILFFSLTFFTFLPSVFGFPFIFSPFFV